MLVLYDLAMCSTTAFAETMTRMLPIAVLCTLFASAACSESPPPPPPRNPLVLAPTEAAEISLPEPTTADLVYNVRHSELVVAAEVVRLEPVSSQVAAPCTQQGVTYRVVEVLHGSTPAEELRVAHPVCLGRPFIDNRAFGLSGAYFVPGRKLVLFLNRDETGRMQYGSGEWVSDYWVWDERNGTLIDSDELHALVARARKASGGAGASGDPFNRGRRKR